MYNNITARNKCDAKVDQRHGILSIEITRDTPFKVYIYSARKLTEMDLWKDFRDRFDEDIRRDGEKIKSLKAKLVQLKKDHEANLKLKSDLEQQLARANAELEGYKERAKALQTAQQSACATMTSEVHKMEEARLAIEADPSNGSISAIERIFRENNIRNDLVAAMAAFDEANAKLASNIAANKDVIETFLAGQNALLQELLVSRWHASSPAV